MGNIAASVKITGLISPVVHIIHQVSQYTRSLINNRLDFIFVIIWHADVKEDEGIIQELDVQ